MAVVVGAREKSAKNRRSRNRSPLRDRPAIKIRDMFRLNAPVIAFLLIAALFK